MWFGSAISMLDTTIEVSRGFQEMQLDRIIVETRQFFGGK